MKTKTIVTIAIIFSSVETLLWALGLIFADINFFIASMILLVISIVPAVKYFSQLSEFFSKRKGEVIEDERTKHIEAKAALPAFVIMLALCIYSAIAIFTLRYTYPQYIELAYPFVIIGVIGFVVHTIATAYYKRV